MLAQDKIQGKYLVKSKNKGGVWGKNIFPELNRDQFLRHLRIKWQLRFSFNSYARIYIQGKKMRLTSTCKWKTLGHECLQLSGNPVLFRLNQELKKKHAKAEQNVEIILLNKNQCAILSRKTAFSCTSSNLTRYRKCRRGCKTGSLLYNSCVGVTTLRRYPQ